MKLKGACLFAALLMVGCGGGDDGGDNYDGGGGGGGGGTTCTNGNTRCSGNLLQTCVNGTWNAGTDCGTNTCTTVSATVAQCSGGGGGGGGGGVCDDYPSDTHYTCDGNTTVACQDGSEAGSWDCADLLGDSTVSGVCYDFGGAWESDCVFPAGTACAFSTESGMAIFACGTTTPSTTMGCDLYNGCVTGQTSCTPSDSFVPICNGNHLIVDCFDFSSVQQPILLDCASADLGSGTCNNANGQCEHSTSGGPCDGATVVCTGGLTCQNIDSNSGVGECL